MGVLGEIQFDGEGRCKTTADCHFSSLHSWQAARCRTAYGGMTVCRSRSLKCRAMLRQIYGDDLAATEASPRCCLRHFRPHLIPHPATQLHTDYKALYETIMRTNVIKCWSILASIMKVCIEVQCRGSALSHLTPSLRLTHRRESIKSKQIWRRQSVRIRFSTTWTLEGMRGLSNHASISQHPQ